MICRRGSYNFLIMIIFVLVWRILEVFFVGLIFVMEVQFDLQNPFVNFFTVFFQVNGDLLEI